METIQITLPSSKSLSNRWLALDYLSSSGIKIKNLSAAEDTQLFKRLLRQFKMGRRHTFDCRDAGTAARFLTALFAVTPGTNVIIGTERLCQRPMKPLIDALRSIGCQIKCLEKEGFLPLQINGLVPTATRVAIDCSQSSQFASALLLAAAAMPRGLAVELTDMPVSEHYLTMTLEVFNHAGVKWALKGNPPAYYVEHSIPKCDAVAIEKDWSAASFFYTVAALDPGRRIHMSGLCFPSQQGDSVAKDIFEQLGVISDQTGLAIQIERTQTPVSKLDCDFTNTPDLFPAVAVACAGLGIEARLTGLSHLRLKESDRVNAVATELRKMKCLLEVTESELHIYPSQLEPTQPVATYDDHRIAMAFASLKVRYPNIEILDPEVVSKSFPAFWEMLERAIAKE